MNGRCAERNTGNVRDIDVWFRSNVHESIGLMYGFQQNSSLVSEIKMQIDASVGLLIKQMLQAGDISMRMEIDELLARVEQHLLVDGAMSFMADMALATTKMMQADEKMVLETIIYPTILQILSAQDISSSLSFGAMENEQFTQSGFGVGLIIKSKVRDYYGTTLAEMYGRTLNELSFTRVY